MPRPTGSRPCGSEFCSGCSSSPRFPQVLPGLQTFVVRDYGFFAYPLAHFQQEYYRHGELPLWNPYNNCGMPFLAQWNTMPLYPPSLFYLLLPLHWSLGFFCLLHLWFAGLGHVFPRAPVDGRFLRGGVRRRGVCLQRPDAEPAHVAEPHGHARLDALGGAGRRIGLARRRTENHPGRDGRRACKCSPADRKSFCSRGFCCWRCGSSNLSKANRPAGRCCGGFRWWWRW